MKAVCSFSSVTRIDRVSYLMYISDIWDGVPCEYVFCMVAAGRSSTFREGNGREGEGVRCGPDVGGVRQGRRPTFRSEAEPFHIHIKSFPRGLAFCLRLPRRVAPRIFFLTGHGLSSYVPLLLFPTT